MDSKPKVLFVCTYRGGRSQIADAYAKKHSRGLFESECACFDPGMISREFVELVASLGLTINRESPKSIFDASIRGAQYHAIICICSSVGTEMCSLFQKNIKSVFSKVPHRIHWDILDFSACQNAQEGFEACAQATCLTIEAEVIKLKEAIERSLKLV